MFYRITNSEWRWVSLPQWIPNNVEPVAVTELRRLVPFVCRQPNRVSTRSTFDFDATDSSHGVAITGLRIGRTKAPNVKTDFQVTHSLTLPTPSGLVCHNQVFGSFLGTLPQQRIDILGRHGRRYGLGTLREDQGRP